MVDIISKVKCASSWRDRTQAIDGITDQKTLAEIFVHITNDEIDKDSPANKQRFISSIVSKLSNQDILADLMYNKRHKYKHVITIRLGRLIDSDGLSPALNQSVLMDIVAELTGNYRYFTSESLTWKAVLNKITSENILNEMLSKCRYVGETAANSILRHNLCLLLGHNTVLQKEQQFNYEYAYFIERYFCKDCNELYSFRK